MALLTNRRGPEGFAWFETALGLALLISAALYLQSIDGLNPKLNCDEIRTRNQNQTQTNNKVKVEAVTAELNVCANLQKLRSMAILGICTGSLLVLILPFICCCVCCAACGACVYLCLGGDFQSEQNIARECPKADRELDSDLGGKKKKNKYDLHNMPEPVQRWTNLLGWLLWVMFPLVSTEIILTSLHKYNALRTDNDSLYNTGLAFFVRTLLNFSLFFQKVMEQICGYIRALVLNRKIIKRQNKLIRQQTNGQRVAEEQELKGEDEENQLKEGKSESVNQTASQVGTVQEK